MARVEIISGAERRRHWTDEQKRTIVTESFAPGAVVSAVARRAEVCPGQIYRWRQEFRSDADGFARVLIAPPEPSAPSRTDDPEPAIEIEFCRAGPAADTADGSAGIGSRRHQSAVAMIPVPSGFGCGWRSVTPTCDAA
jgi:transposase